MKIIVVGGGKVGFYLAKTLLEHGNHPVLIEREKELCRHTANSLDIPIICGDGTSIEVLDSAGTKSAEAVVAVTGQDENNLICCQLAKKVFSVGRTVARVNNPKNAEVMKRLGVDIPISSTDNIARLLEREVDTSLMKQLITFDRGTTSLTQVELPEGLPFEGKPLSDIKIPNDAVIVSVVRDQEFIIPRGNTVLRAGDKVMLLAKNEALHYVKAMFLPGEGDITL